VAAGCALDRKPASRTNQRFLDRFSRVEAALGVIWRRNIAELGTCGGRPRPQSALRRQGP